MAEPRSQRGAQGVIAVVRPVTTEEGVTATAEQYGRGIHSPTGQLCVAFRGFRRVKLAK